MLDRRIADKNCMKLKRIAKRYLKTKKYDKALKTISLLGDMMYNLNITYSDDEIENMIKTISYELLHSRISNLKGRNKRILFFDGFGLDTRGLALIYIKALTEANYDIVYVTLKHKKLALPQITDVLRGNANNVMLTIEGSNLIKGIYDLNDIVRKYHIDKAFLYTRPADMIGIPVFTAYAGVLERYMINLTDHAFWLGKNTFDFILEFRDYGAIISAEKRNIVKSKLLKQPYYPMVNTDIKFEGFPFEPQNFKIIFSGGALYKTFGDNNIYYQIIDHLLSKHKDIIFLYAGEGDGSELKRLTKKYPDRVYWIAERKDLYQLMKHSYFYLSTYPMIGGLMTQYAVVAGTVPFTLIYDDCATGILLEPEKIGTEFTDYKKFVQCIDEMIDHPELLDAKKENLNCQLITPEMFKENLIQIIEKKTSRFEIYNRHIETERFQRTYLERLSRKTYCKLFVKRNSLFLIKYFPLKSIMFFIITVKEKLCRL